MNREYEIRYRGKNVFDVAFNLAFLSEYDKTGEQGTKAVGYKIENNKLFLFYYEADADKKGLTLFPYKMNSAQCNVFVWGWLQSVKPIGEYPDTDGSVEQGFKITTDGCDWRGGSMFYGSFIAIEPVWIVYGK